MNTEHIKEFLVLSTCETFQDAAARLFISQSSLSKHMHFLSAELGSELFQFENRKARLTPFGEEFLSIAHKIDDLYEHSIELAKINPDVTRLCIGTDLSDSTWVTTILPDFIADHPDINLECLCADYQQLENMLRHNKLSVICFNSIEDSFPGAYKAVSYAYDTLYAILPASHNLAGYDEICLSQLSKDNFVEKSRYSSSYNILIKLCNIAGFEPHIPIYVNRRSAQLNLVSNGSSVAIIEKSALTKLDLKNNNVVAVKLSRPNTLYYTFMTMQEHSSSATEQFLEFIGNCFSGGSGTDNLFSISQYAHNR